MDVFHSLYKSLVFPIEEDGQVGFRPPQLAAIQAASAHLYSNPTQPAIVTMPTGSGKTLILITLSISTRAKRVLVLTPSRLVREQIAEEFTDLADLIKIKALPPVVHKPRVQAPKKRIKKLEDWEAFEEADVVVATVSSISGKDVPLPPEGLFDLILVDEAHHAPAKTWSRILEAHNGIKQVLFTATPFRNDQKQIQGKIVFNYRLKQANEDRVFGDIHFQPVTTTATTEFDIDLAIAKATEQKFNEDKELNLKHLVMVRVDSKKRGKTLHELYSEHTSLRLSYVTGQTSLKVVKSVVKKLKEGELDGIVCVNMFGEGFNLPNLKIAAVHAPHKSLAITLQFIGRFARTTAPDIGAATFLAEPQSSAEEIEELYEDGASWQQIVANLSEGRIASETKIREELDTFEHEFSSDLVDLELGAIRPYFHAKIYRCEICQIDERPSFPDRMKIAYEFISRDLNCAVFVTRESTRPRWTVDERFHGIQWELYIVYFDSTNGLLFICASDRSTEMYNELAKHYIKKRIRPISSQQVNRALGSLSGAHFFNVGMRKRSRIGLTESYRTLAGPKADHAVVDSDSRTYDRGHCFGKGRNNGIEVTLGVSASGKNWSNKAAQVPTYLDWCKELARYIGSGNAVKTGSPIDSLGVGEEIDVLPKGIVAALLPESQFDHPKDVYFSATGEEVGNLLDFEISVTKSVEGCVFFRLSNGSISWEGVFSLEQDQFIERQDSSVELFVDNHGIHVPLDEFFCDELPIFFTDKFESIQGSDLYDPPNNGTLFSEANLEIVDWKSAGVNIENEKPDGTAHKSIFEWLEERLLADPGNVFVFCDDASLEVADYIALRWEDETPVFELYHCKASDKPTPGIRVKDFYEVAFQAAKCAKWAQRGIMHDRLVYRHSKNAWRLKKGSMTELSKAFSSDHRQKLKYSPIIVQPGLNSKKLTGSPVDELLAAANAYVLDSGMHSLKVICS